MQNEVYLYNTLSRKKELLEPLNPPHVGIYVCGPTVYGDPHLGHARPGIVFDLLFRYLKHLDYKVRYVRNITDVGHLEDDADDGEDKIAKKARLEKLEPMEVAQYYTNRYHHYMDKLNVLRPSIEPKASGHIIEQQEMIEMILKNGFAYEVNGSVYFDVEKYHKSHFYGKLSGRKVEDLMRGSRSLEGQDEKKNPIDFALWKKASPEHIMRWRSPWSTGFPGWHLECSVMSMKYLGEEFDIHGGGMDLLFPHHECEIAQSVAATGKEAVKRWMHNNLITINGQKMGKSLGNFITLEELFKGTHKLLDQAYSPMTIRFFIMQAHYRNPLDFSNEALQAAEKGMERLFDGVETLDNIIPEKESTVNTGELVKKCYDAMNDDLNSPVLISHLFDGVKLINNIASGKETIDKKSLDELKKLYHDFVFDILGMEKAEEGSGSGNKVNELMDLILNIRKDARSKKDFETSDKIRDELTKLGIEIKDTKDGAEWKTGK